MKVGDGGGPLSRRRIVTSCRTPSAGRGEPDRIQPIADADFGSTRGLQRKSAGRVLDEDFAVGPAQCRNTIDADTMAHGLVRTKLRQRRNGAHRQGGGHAWRRFGRAQITQSWDEDLDAAQLTPVVEDGAARSLDADLRVDERSRLRFVEVRNDRPDLYMPEQSTAAHPLRRADVLHDPLGFDPLAIVAAGEQIPE